ncbi:MAG: hypothetical protein M1814_006178 [Vezdaea aestivalis]|nr:MAG: hypothetical protein M1814_006178 [Vezdaea aestivalis]
MAVATIGPTLVGDAADLHGRRSVYIVILSIYIASCVAIAAANSYPALVALRVVQALAISGTFSIAYGVVTDIASPAERGSFTSVVSFAITIAPTLGPIVGGSLAFAAGWAWIFWFLSLASGLCLLLMIFLLPETARNIVGDGSISPPKFLRLPVPFSSFSHWKENYDSEEGEILGDHEWRFPNPFKSVSILLRKDNLVIIIACGLLYVVYTCVNTSLSVLCVDIYNLTQWQAGLIYIPFGVGGILSTFLSGPLLNSAYRKARKKQGYLVDRAVDDDLDNFDIEKTRIGVIWLPLIFTSFAVLAFGWVLHYRKHLAIALTLQFVAGLCMQLDFSIYNTLLVDKNHRCPATAQASSNIVRCALAAVVVAFLQRMFEALGIGWTFTLMSGLCLACVGLFLIDYHKGMTWRQSKIGPIQVQTFREFSPPPAESGCKDSK